MAKAKSIHIRVPYPLYVEARRNFPLHGELTSYLKEVVTMAAKEPERLRTLFGRKDDDVRGPSEG